MVSLEVRLSTDDEAPDSVVIEVSNVNEEHPVTILRWDTPLDPHALDLGVVTLSDATSGRILPGPALKLNRKLPAPREDLVEIGPGQTVTRKLQLKGFWLLEKGTSVRVHAKGEWKAVWKARKDEVSDGELEARSGERVSRGPFQSDNSVEVRL